MGIFSLSFRYLRSRRVALVAVLAIATGVMAMIVVVALMDGVQIFIKDHFKGTQADIRVTHALAGTDLRRHWDRTRVLLLPETLPGGSIQALSPRVTVEALVVPGKNPGPGAADRLQGVRLVGIDFDLESEVTPFERMFSEVREDSRRIPLEERKRALHPRDHPSIILGDSLARELGVTRLKEEGNNLVTLFTADIALDDQGNPQGEDRSEVFNVVGCFSTGRQDYDQFYAYVDRKTLLRVRHEDPSKEVDATSIHIKLHDSGGSVPLARELAARYPELKFLSWEQSNRNELLSINDQKRIMVVILSFIIAVAAVAILGIVYMMIVEKTRDIGILRSMGLGRSRVVLVFTVYGLTLGIIGSLIGLFLGLQLTQHLDAVVNWLSDLTGVKLLNAEIYRFKSIPVHVDSQSVILILVIAVSMSLLASFLPALRAGFMSPVRCLRSD